jgi:hypothetical protein
MMKAICVFAGVLAAVGMVAAQQANAPVLGTWKGESLCTVKPSACHDEVVVYEIKPSSDKKDHLTVKADKIVDGKRQWMGDLECGYADGTGVLTCELDNKKGVWSFNVQGDAMTGTLKLADGTLFRKVSAKRYNGPLPPEEQ